MQYVEIGPLSVSRFIIGSNPFSGFSHQGASRDDEMRRYYTAARIKETLREGEALGVNTVIARTDMHVARLLLEYWDEGGRAQWLAQTCPEVGPPETCIRRAADCGAKGCYIHGGVMDHLLAQNRIGEVPALIALIRQLGMQAGVAGHNPKVFEWAESSLDADFYMCSYYNSANRDQRAEHVSGAPEWFRPEDRETMTRLIRGLRRPVIHYKVLAAGRNDPREAFGYAARRMRAGDAVCCGVFTKGAAGMLAEDVRLLAEAIADAGVQPEIPLAR